MCVDFTDLNKACPKDSYPLPSIDALVDSASKCRLFSFLDAFSGYNQIMMHPRDECKTAFMTELSCYCYKAMLFGLKNVGATYQRLMDRVLAPILGRNVQAYVDDMVVLWLAKKWLSDFIFGDVLLSAISDHLVTWVCIRRLHRKPSDRRFRYARDRGTPT